MTQSQSSIQASDGDQEPPKQRKLESVAEFSSPGTQVAMRGVWIAVDEIAKGNGDLAGVGGLPSTWRVKQLRRLRTGISEAPLSLLSHSESLYTSPTPL